VLFCTIFSGCLGLLRRVSSIARQGCKHIGNGFWRSTKNRKNLPRCRDTRGPWQDHKAWMMPTGLQAFLSFQPEECRPAACFSVYRQTNCQGPSPRQFVLHWEAEAPARACQGTSLSQAMSSSTPYVIVEQDLQFFLPLIR
jgi:hypothetical protein